MFCQTTCGHVTIPVSPRGYKKIASSHAFLLIAILLVCFLASTHYSHAADCNANGQDDLFDVTTMTEVFKQFEDSMDNFNEFWYIEPYSNLSWYYEDATCLLSKYPNANIPPISNNRWVASHGLNCSYDIGGPVVSLLRSHEAHSIEIPKHGGKLEWWQFVETENAPGVDIYEIQVSTDLQNWASVFSSTESHPYWHKKSVDLSNFAGTKIYLRLVFNSVDRYNNNYLGWLVDNIVIYGYDVISEDKNGNLIPDECEPDCNSNGFPDDYDLATMGSQDCNSNGIPDECDCGYAVRSESPRISPFSYASAPVTYDFGTLPEAQSDVRIDFFVEGSAGYYKDPNLSPSQLEAIREASGITVSLNDSVLKNKAYVRFPQLPPCGKGMTSLILSAEEFNNLISSNQGRAVISLAVGPEVAPRCDPSSVKISLSYLKNNPSADCNKNSIPDVCEFQDCNGNGLFDVCEVNQGLEQDCNANLIPDVCEIAIQDCNGNGQPDDCDLQSVSYDCNANGIPDECDIAAGANDCNSNGIIDECELRENLSEDTNGNGVPDDCEIDPTHASACLANEQESLVWAYDFAEPFFPRADFGDHWTTQALNGSNTWFYPPSAKKIPPYPSEAVVWGGSWPSITDSVLEMTDYVQIPTSGITYLLLTHKYDFESELVSQGSTNNVVPVNYDGGVIEYQTDETSSTWVDLGPQIILNGYRGVISKNYQNPLGGRKGFVGSTRDYVITKVYLNFLAGKKVKFRFRTGTDWSGVSNGWLIRSLKISVCGVCVDEQRREDFSQSPQGWVEFTRIPSDGSIARAEYDSVDGALCARVSSAAGHIRVAGMFTDSTSRLPYISVGSDKYVRGKFYIYAKGLSDPTQLNTIPCVRLRLANRFAVTSLLEVNSHVNASSGDEPVTLELRPSTDAQKPSLYRVDFDPVDVPWLRNNSFSEGILRGFEAYSVDPQDNGVICLAESSIAVYHKSWVTPEVSELKLLKLYSVSENPSGPGDFDLTLEETNVERGALKITGDGTFPIRSVDTTLGVWGTPSGLTLTSESFDNYAGGYRLGAIQVDLSPGPRDQRVRVEPNKQYMVRFHVTSSQQSNLNPQLRLRVRSLRFGWVQKLEIGGAWAIDSRSHHILARQALPGIGCMNPDKMGTENGGWYTVLFHTPMNPDIRPDVEGTLCEKMPNICAQPGPGVDAPSLRDLKVGVDLIDTLSTSIYKDLEAGNFTVDRIEVFSFNTIPD